MKKKIWFVLALTLSGFLFMSFSPSLDGRAVVADEGVLPQGIFAKTVGYLPGDSISVTNLVDKTTVDILVIGALDPSEGVAILLSPEAAKLLGIEKDSNNVVKITKRSGQLDEIVAGTALIGKSQASQEEKKSDKTKEEPLVPPVEEVEEANEAELEETPEVSESIENAEETLPVSEEETVIIEEKPLSVPLEESLEDAESEKIDEELPVSEEIVTEEVVENPSVPEKEILEEAVTEEETVVENIQMETAEPEENIPSEKIDENNVSDLTDSDLSEAINEEKLSENVEQPLEKLDSEELSPVNEEAIESEKVSENLNEEPVENENAEKISDSIELSKENVENNIEEIEETVSVSSEAEKIVEEKEDEITSDSEKITDELDFSNTHIDVLKAEKVEEELPLPQEEIKSEKISDDGELYSEKEKNASEPEEEKILANGDTLIESEEKRKAEEPVASERIYPEVIDEKYLEGPEKDVSTVPFVEDEVPSDYDKYLEELKKQKEKEEIFVPENKPVEEKIPVSEPEKETVLPESENISSEESENLASENAELNSSLNESVKTEPEIEAKTESDILESSSEESYEAIVLVPAENNPPSEEKEELSNDILPLEDNVVENVKTEIVSDKSEEVKESEVKENAVEVKSEPEKSSYDFDSVTVENLKALESGKYYIQIAVLSDENNIKSIFDKYYGKYPIVLVPLKSGAAKQVLIGPLSVDEYGTVLQRFKSYGYKDAFLRKIK